MGMKSFVASGINTLQFATSIGITTTVSSTVNFKYLSFMYWTFRLRVCPTGFPYFDAITLLCYDVCAGGKYMDIPTLQCLPCHYSCQNCTAYLTCVTCDTAAYRALVGSACPPIAGYYDNLTSTAVACNSTFTNCTTCDTIPGVLTCYTCSMGTYLDPITTLCQPCATGCADCTSATQCNICLTGYTVNQSGYCVRTSCTDVNCIICVDPSICNNCTTGYSVVSGACAIVCGDGQLGGT